MRWTGRPAPTRMASVNFVINRRDGGKPTGSWRCDQKKAKPKKRKEPEQYQLFDAPEYHYRVSAFASRAIRLSQGRGAAKCSIDPNAYRHSGRPFVCVGFSSLPDRHQPSAFRHPRPFPFPFSRPQSNRLSQRVLAHQTTGRHTRRKLSSCARCPKERCTNSLVQSGMGRSPDARGQLWKGSKYEDV